MKYAVIAALCASAVSAACDPADAPVKSVAFYSKEGCAEADMVKNEGATKTATDGYVTQYNAMVKAMKACVATPDNIKANVPATAKFVKHNDCADGKIAVAAFSDDKCATSVDLTDDQKKKTTLATWGECKKVEPKMGDKDYWMKVTGARDLTAAVAAAMLAVGAAMY